MTTNNQSEAESINKKVLMLYTGGTIGMLHPDNDPLKPLKSATWAEMEKFIPGLNQLHVSIDHTSIQVPVDSAAMTPEHWLEIAQIVEKNYCNYDGFVILHGTDTMTYTASALSFMLQNLSKPIVLTGSQLPLGEARSDALQNLITSIMIAAATDSLRKLPIIPEVCIFFRDDLMRGNRARKYSAKDYSGFISPNYPVLATAGEHIEVHEKSIRRPSTDQFFVNSIINKNVLAFTIFPGTSIDVLNSIFNIPRLKGVVLNTYGAGNAPLAGAFLETIRRAVQENQIVVVNVTQCLQGIVEMGLYETSAMLLDQGVVSGLDMSTEAALCKLSVLLGREDLSPEEIAMLMQINQCGEMSKSIYTINFGGGETLNSTYNSQPKPILGGLNKDRIEQAIIRVVGIELPDTVEGLEFKVRVFINRRNVDLSTLTNLPHFAGEKNERWQKGLQPLHFDATQAVKAVVDPKNPVSVSIVASQTLRWKRLNLLIHASAENGT